MSEVNNEVEKMHLEHFVVKPLNKDLHLKFREIAINYEIALELKAKEYDKARIDKKGEIENIV